MGRNKLNAVMVRMSHEQLALLDAEVERLRAECNEALRITRSHALRRALVEMARRAKRAA